MDIMEDIGIYCIVLSIIGKIASFVVTSLASALENNTPYIMKIRDWMRDSYYAKISNSLFFLSLLIMTLLAILHVIFDDIPLSTRLIIGLPCSFGIIMFSMFLLEQWKCELLVIKNCFRPPSNH